MRNAIYTHQTAVDFTTKRNTLWITGYIRKHFYVTRNNIPSEIIVLINHFYITQLYHSFGDLILYEEIAKGLHDDNLHEPNSIQQHSILSILNGDNIITKGKPYRYDKTTTICITQLQKVNLKLNTCQILTISSSRERTQHLYQRTKVIGKHLPVINELCIGGTTVSQDMQMLSQDIQIMHGVVGRIYELLKRNALNVEGLKLFILDDADNLFDKGFREQIDEIITHLPCTVQIAMFCSRLSNQVRQFEQTYLQNKSVHINVKRKSNNMLTLKNMKQYYVPVEDEQYKLHELFDILESLLLTKCIVYCNSKEKTMWLHEQMKEYDFTVAMLHIDMNDNQFRDSMNDFLNGSAYILVSMDLNRMNMNILKQVSLIINYDLAIDNESYLLRNGSYQKKGIAINFVCDDQLPISKLEIQHSTQMDELPITIESILK